MADSFFRCIYDNNFFKYFVLFIFTLKGQRTLISLWPIQSKVSRKMQKNAEKCSTPDFCVLFFVLGVRAASSVQENIFRAYKRKRKIYN